MSKNNNDLKEDFKYLEKLIVKNCLENEQFLSIVIPYLNPEIFQEKHNKIIVDVLQRYFKLKNKRPTSTELSIFLSTDKLKESYRFVKNYCNDITEEIDFDTLLDHTEKFLKLQSFENTILNIVSDWGKEKNKDVILPFYSHVEKIIGYNLRSRDGHDYFDDLNVYIDYLSKDTNFISTGLPWLDEQLSGGYLQDGRALYMFAGMTNIGKSIFLHNAAVNILKQNKKVLLFSLEMSEQMYNNRLTSTIANLDINNLKNSIQEIKSNVEKFKMMRPNAGLIIKEYPPSSITPAVLKTFTKQLISAKKFKPDVIIIDYLNLLVGVGDNSYTKIKDVAEQIRAMSFEFECPVISATQLNKGGFGDTTPQLEHVGESYGLSATCDAMIGIFRTEQDKEDKALHCNVMKNRFNSNTGVTRVGIDYRTMTIFEDESLNVNDDVNNIERSAGEYAER